MPMGDFFTLIASFLTWIKKILAALGLSKNETVSKFVDNIDNALDTIDTEPNTTT